MLTIDETDPCAAAATLRQSYLQLVSGVAAQTISMQSGPNGVERTTVFHKANAEGLLRLVRHYESLCAKQNGARSRRHALRAGGRR